MVSELVYYVIVILNNELFLASCSFATHAQSIAQSNDFTVARKKHSYTL